LFTYFVFLSPASSPLIKFRNSSDFFRPDGSVLSSMRAGQWLSINVFSLSLSHDANFLQSESIYLGVGETVPNILFPRLQIPLIEFEMGLFLFYQNTALPYSSTFLQQLLEKAYNPLECHYSSLRILPGSPICSEQHPRAFHDPRSSARRLLDMRANGMSRCGARSHRRTP
jgi:hypothetical protein